ncbi:DUF4097 family beta strand repeat-containing protein [Marinactinospora rubrisoli]|uniref:DUF4097 family beta strand repeat-containing protein n=1 Tax=Marinactinospora rubrisoli TaxID=2715399 RepID=A0ABW2K951_9ACTN
MSFTGHGAYAAVRRPGPRRRRRPAVAVVAVLLAGGGLAGALALVPTGTEQRSDDVAGVTRLTVRNPTGGAVEVRADSGAEAVTLLRSLRSGLAASPMETVHQEGGTLSVAAECTGPLPGPCSVDYTITVPEDITVVAESTSGAVDVLGVRGAVTVRGTSGAVGLSDVTGDVDVATTTGTVHASGRGDALAAESSTGDLDLSGFTAATAEATTSTGAIRMGAVQQADVSATTGAVELTAPGGFERVAVETTTGSVDVTVSAAFRELAVTTTTGAVDLRVPDAAYRVTGASTTGDRAVDVATAADARAVISVDTTTGSVAIRPE